MTAPRVYCAAPYEDAGFVREHVHDRLRALGFEPSSRWAESAFGHEDLTSFTTLTLRRIAAGNDADIDGSAALLMLARKGAGGECFAEAARALLRGIPVVWVGRRTLSAWREGVVRVDDLDDALQALLVITKGMGE